MKRLLIVFHSQSGSTQKLAFAVRDGAQTEPDVEVRCLRALEAGFESLQWCDAVIFGSPENFGFLSGGLKDFLDRTFYPALAEGLTRPYAVFISAGNDGTGAIRQLERIAKGYPLKAVAEPLIIKGEVTEEGTQSCYELGQAVAAGLDLGIF